MKSGELRHFESEDDLFDSETSDQILKWVNEYWEMKEAQRFSGRKYRRKKQIFQQVAMKLLSVDEIARVEEEAAFEAGKDD